MNFFNAKGTDLRILVLTFEAINSREELITFRHYAAVFGFNFNSTNYLTYEKLKYAC